MTTLLTPISVQNVGPVAGIDEDVEPDAQWKESLRARIEKELQSTADKVREDRDSQLRGIPEGSSQWEAVMKSYNANMDRVRRIAQEQFNHELKIARFERSLALGKEVEGAEFEQFRLQQQAIWEAIKKGGTERPQGRRDSSVVPSPNNQENGDPNPPRASGEHDTRGGPSMPYRDSRPLARGPPASESRARDRTQSGGSDQLGTPASYGTRPARSRGNSSVFGVDFDPTSSGSTLYDQGSIGRQSLSSLSRTRPQDIWLPTPSPKDNSSPSSRTFAHATASNPSPISPNVREGTNDNGRTVSRAGSIRSTERPSPLADFEPGSSLPRDRFGMGSAEDRSSSRKGKEPDRSDHQRQPSFTQQTAVHDIYARRPDSRMTAPITPSRPTAVSQGSEDQYFPQISPVNARYRQDSDELEGIPIRSSRRSVTSDQGSPENMRYGPPNSASARPIPPKRSFPGDFDSWAPQPPSSSRPYFGPQSPSPGLAASSSRPIPRPATSDEDTRLHFPSGAWHDSQSPPSALPFAGYDVPLPFNSNPHYRYSSSPAGSVNGRRNSNGSRSVRSRSSRQEFWGPSDVSQRPLPTFEEQSVASDSDSDEDYGMDLDDLWHIRERQELRDRHNLTWKLVREEQRRLEVANKAQEAKRLEEEARRKQEEAARKEEEARQKAEEARRKEEEVKLKALEIQQKQEELARREAELLRREAEAKLQEEIRKREEAEARLQEEIRKRQEAEAEAKRRVQEEAERREREQSEREAREKREREEREERERREREERERRDRDERERKERERREKDEREKSEKERQAREEKERRQRENEEKERRDREERERREEHERRAREQEEWRRRQREQEARLAQEKREWEETRRREAEAAASAAAQAQLESERLRAVAAAAAEAEAQRQWEERRRREEQRQRDVEAQKEREAAAEAQRQREEEAQRRRAEAQEREAEAQRQREVEAQRQREAEAQRQRELEAQRQRELELKRRQEAEAQIRREAADKAAAERAAAEAEAQRRQEAEARQREADEAQARAAEAERSRHQEPSAELAEFNDPQFLLEQQAEFERIQAQREREARLRAEATKRRQEEEEARKKAQFQKEQEEIYKRIQADEQGRLREQEARRRAEEEIRRKQEQQKLRENAILNEVLRRSEEEHRDHEERRRKEGDRMRQDSVGSSSDSNRPGVYFSASSSTPRPIPNPSASFHNNPSVPGDRSSTASSSSFSSSASFFSTSSGRSNSTGYTSSASRTSTASATPTAVPATPSVSATPKAGWKSAPSPATSSPTTASSTRSSSGAYQTAYGSQSSYAQSLPSTTRSTASYTASTPLSEQEWARRQEEHARKQFEQFQREQEAQQRRAEQKAMRQLSKEDVIKLFEEHERRWSRLMSMDVLTWHSFPWPMLKQPTDPEQLTYIEIQAYVLSPHQPGDKTQKERIKDYLRKWHPDRFETKVLPKVREDEREMVKEGAGAVARHLNKLLSSLSGSAENGLFG